MRRVSAKNVSSVLSNSSSVLSSSRFSHGHSGATNEVVIVSAARTPIGSMLGGLSDLTAPQLGTIAVKAVMDRIGLDPKEVGEVLMGNVIGAGQGQHPARQVSLGAGIPIDVPCTNVNKVCASGMKTVMFGAQSIALGHQDVIVAGGFESMSNIPFYIPGARKGFKYGHAQFVDGLIHDGLWDVYGNVHMGNCGEVCAEKYNISRKEQDDYAIASFKRAAAATEGGAFKSEIVPVHVPQKKGNPIVIDKDEQFTKVDFNKLSTLKSPFKKDGSVTAANSSSLNDGASAVILMSAAKAKHLGLKPLAKIRGYADAETEPVHFTVAPALAIPKALKRAGLSKEDIQFWEINEAFAVVALANMKLLGLQHDRLNVNGGAVALGHPIGCSGNRIITTLLHVLEQKDAKLGCAAICNGGGGASAIIIERV